MDNYLLIDKLTKAISYKYREDKTSPNLTISVLKEGYYCSIVRYKGPFNDTKEVVCKATRHTLPEALKDVTNQFLNIAFTPMDPIQELHSIFWSRSDS